MAVFLTIHARYKDVQWGLFRDDLLIDAAADESKKISKYFIDQLDRLLAKNKLEFSELSFIAAHQGPAPFTTLRVCLATVNGFAFATGIPLIGINGLEAFIEKHTSPSQITVVLLNAFSQEVYYALHDPTANTIFYGYAPAEAYLKEISTKYAGPITFLGNGSTLWKDSIQNLFGDRASFEPEELVSIETIGQKALTRWQKKETSTQLMPVYLKNSSAVLAN